MKTILVQNAKIALSNICKLMAAILNLLLIIVIFQIYCQKMNSSPQNTLE